MSSATVEIATDNTVSSPILELIAVEKTFREGGQAVTALSNLSFSVQQGEFVTLLGPSGSGKSTAFNLITGLIQPDHGEIRLNGQRINGQAGRVGYMPQRDLLLPWRTVLQNAVLGAEIAGLNRAESLRRAAELLPVFGLEGFGDVYPATLSGGMRQRAAFLRTVLTGPKVLLLDEPFGALDAFTRAELQQWLLKMWKQLGCTILFITHDVHESVLLSNRVLIFTPRPGHVRITFSIALPRPRHDADPAFMALQAQLLAQLGEIGRLSSERT
jgi:ABC-type nitrate/sulfonate/bicarbonate transport system ATPase subunit